jgi:hypothetical protein
MRLDHLERMVKGWFVGDFEPTLYRTRDVEVAVKRYEAGDHEALHHHAIATELTAVVSGSARMAGCELGPGDIVVLEPGDVSDFTALTDVTTVAVKIPGVPNDKYVHDG